MGLLAILQVRGAMTMKIWAEPSTPLSVIYMLTTQGGGNNMFWDQLSQLKFELFYEWSVDREKRNEPLFQKQYLWVYVMSFLILGIGFGYGVYLLLT